MYPIVTLEMMAATNRSKALNYQDSNTTENSLSTDMTTKKTTTTTTVEEVPKSNEYVVKEADVYKPLAVVSDSTPINSANNQIVGTTASGSLTTPGKIVGDLEPVIAEHGKTTVAEPVTKKVVKTETTETKK